MNKIDGGGVKTLIILLRDGASSKQIAVADLGQVFTKFVRKKIPSNKNKSS